MGGEEGPLMGAGGWDNEGNYGLLKVVQILVVV
jgi:hypothetical protein